MHGRGIGRDGNNNNSSRQVVPCEDEDGDLGEEASPDSAMVAWIAASSRGRGRGTGGSGSGDSDASARGGSSFSRGMSGHHRFGHHRERSAKFRRVKPLPLEESEDARERGVPVPAVGLPEGIQRRVDAKVRERCGGMLFVPVCGTTVLYQVLRMALCALCPSTKKGGRPWMGEKHLKYIHVFRSRYVYIGVTASAAAAGINRSGEMAFIDADSCCCPSSLHVRTELFHTEQSKPGPL